VCDDDKRLPQLRAKVEEEFVEVVGVLGVEVAAGFVGEDDVGLVHEGAGAGSALLFAAGELGGFVVHAVAEAEFGEQGFSAGADFFIRFTRQEAGDHDIFKGRKLRQEVVELEDEADMTIAEGSEHVGCLVKDVDAVDQYRAFVGRIEGSQEVEQRAFAGAGSTDDGDHLTSFHGDIDALEYLEGAVRFLNAFCFQHPAIS